MTKVTFSFFFSTSAYVLDFPAGALSNSTKCEHLILLYSAKLKWKKLQCAGSGPERRLGHTAVLIYGQVR